MPKAEVYSADSNPQIDRPLFYGKVEELELAVSSGKLIRLGPRSFQKIQIAPRELNARLSVLDEPSGYDRATRLGAASDMTSVWGIRLSDGFSVWQMDGSKIRPQTAFQRRNQAV